MLTVMMILAVLALLAVIVSLATNKCPLWVPVLLLAIYACLEQIPKD